MIGSRGRNRVRVLEMKDRAPADSRRRSLALKLRAAELAYVAARVVEPHQEPCKEGDYEGNRRQNHSYRRVGDVIEIVRNESGIRVNASSCPVYHQQQSFDTCAPSQRDREPYNCRLGFYALLKGGVGRADLADIGGRVHEEVAIRGKRRTLVFGDVGRRVPHTGLRVREFIISYRDDLAAALQHAELLRKESQGLVDCFSLIVTTDGRPEESGRGSPGGARHKNCALSEAFSRRQAQGEGRGRLSGNFMRQRRQATLEAAL